VDLRDLIPDSQKPNSSLGASGMWHGRVVEPVPFYPNMSAPLFFVIHDLEPNTVWNTIHWQLRTSDNLVNLAESGEIIREVRIAVPVWPIVGSEVLVTFDNRQHWWVVAWK
jgi:hypothetical protein